MNGQNLMAILKLIMQSIAYLTVRIIHFCLYQSFLLMKWLHFVIWRAKNITYVLAIYFIV